MGLNKKLFSVLLISLLILGAFSFSFTPKVFAQVTIDTTQDSWATAYSNTRKLVRLSDGTLYCVYTKKVDFKIQVFVKHSVSNGQYWIGETHISTYAGMETDSNYYPSIAVDSNNHLHVVWSGRATGYLLDDQIWYAKYEAGWATPVRISTYSGMGDDDQRFPSIAVDSNDYLHVVWDGYATGYTSNKQIWYAKYEAGWATPVRISTYSGMNNHGHSCASIAVDSIYRLHVVWYGRATGYTTDSQVWYAKYEAGWVTPVRISTYSGMNIHTQACCSIAVDSANNPHVVWHGKATDYTLNDQVWYAKYEAGWVTPVRISIYYETQYRDQYHSSIAVGSNDWLHVVWHGRNGEIWYNKYVTDWNTPEVIYENGQNKYPNLRWSRYPSWNIPIGVEYVFTLGTGAPLNVTYNLPTPLVAVEAENVDDDGADWVFTNWKYYTFTVTTDLTALDNVSIGFVMPTGEEDIMCGFFSNGDDWTYSSNMTYESREGEPCKLNAGSWNETSGEVTFDIWFEDRILDVWDPVDNVDVYVAFDASDWFLGAYSLFRIYSKGGFEMNYASTGDAGKLAGGTPFSLYGHNGSIVYNEIWYRDGQHIKLMPDIHFLAGLDPFYVRYGVDYSLGDGEWLEGWAIYINPKFVSYTGIFAANVWINMTNLWWNRGGMVTSEDLYMFYHGSVTDPGDSGHWQLWLDLWFSDKNASRVGAAKLNAYEYPMIDSADLWLRWLANNWGVKDNVLKEMSLEIPLLDTDNSTVISSEKIKMVRFWCELEVDDADSGQYVYIKNYGAFDVTHSRELPLVGISAPVFDETLLPTVGQKGILGALWTMFAGLGQWLSENVIFGGLNLWSTFVNFLDTIAGMFGAPKFFTNLFDWIYELLGFVYLSAGYIGTIATSLFSLIGSLLGTFLTIMAEIITRFVDTITMFTDMMAGGYGVGVDLWETFGISQWITVAIIFYPLYLIILWDQEGMDAVIKQLTMMFGILSWLFAFFVTVIQFTIGLITTVIESIPVAE